ncbi:hypothetical protein ACKVWC_002263 [Pyricularia oryzae]|nr:hypothetical protein MCOR30_003445 [Pyricularia oryzae]KAI6489863.1 hypothetical protein MCOR11_007725 [Pyricularia oryzae]
MSKLGNVVLVGTIVVLSGPLALAAISTTFVAATLLLLFAGAVFVHAVLKSLYQVTTWPFSAGPATLTTTAVPNSPRSASLKPAAKGQKVTAPQQPPSLAIKTGRWTSSTVSKAGSCSPESSGSVTSSYSRSSSSSSNGGGSNSSSSSSTTSDGAIEQAHIINGISQAVGNASAMEGSLRGGFSRRRRPAASLLDFYDDEFDDANFVDEVYFPEDEDMDMDGPWPGLGAEMSRHHNRSYDRTYDRTYDHTYDHTLLRRHRSASVAGFTLPVASNSSRRRASIAELPSVLQSATMSSISYRRSSTPGRRRVRSCTTKQI